MCDILRVMQKKCHNICSCTQGMATVEQLPAVDSVPRINYSWKASFLHGQDYTWAYSLLSGKCSYIKDSVYNTLGIKAPKVKKSIDVTYITGLRTFSEKAQCVQGRERRGKKKKSIVKIYIFFIFKILEYILLEWFLQDGKKQIFRWLSGKKIHLLMQETQVRSLGWEDPLEEEMATHSSILAWKIPWTEEPGGLQSMRLQRVRHE